MKKSIKRSSKQLQLTGETLRQLTTLDLPGVAGGDVTTTVKSETPSNCVSGCC